MVLEMNNKLSMKNAALVNIGAKYIVVILQLVYQAILARLLTPSDYGIVAVITIFVNFFSLLADLGIGNAIIQNQELTQYDVNSIYSWSIRFAFVLGICFAVLSYPISVFYGDWVYIGIGMLLSISVIFSELNMVPNALLLKKKNFILIGIRQIVVCIISSIIAVVLAIMGARYYALVAYSIVSSIITYFWNLHGSGLRFSLSYDKKSIQKVKSFSAYLFGFNVMNYFSRNLDNMLIGKTLGTEQLGYYNKAYQLMLYPMNNFTNVITPVLLPFLSEHQNDKKYVYNQYIRTVKILSLLGVYITAFCFFASKELIVILYGNQWIDSVKCFQFLSITIWSQMICATSGSMFQVLDCTKLQFQRGIIATITTLSCIGIGVFSGSIEGTAFFVMLAYMSNFITMLLFLIKGAFKESVAGFLKLLLPDALIAVVLCVFFRLEAGFSINNTLLSFLIKLCVSGIVYLILLIAFKQVRYFNILLPKSIMRKFQQTRK